MRSLKYSPVVAIMVVFFLTKIYGSPVIHAPSGTRLPNPISMSNAVWRDGGCAAGWANTERKGELRC